MRITKNTTIREFLQTLGTECLREQLSNNIHVAALFADYKEKFTGNNLKKSEIENENYWKEPKWIITDLRYPNELKAIEDRDGITIRVNRFNKEDFNDIANGRDNKHSSETALDKSEFKYTIDNNGSIEELIEKVKEILINEEII